MVYNKENFRKHISTINVEGFKLKSVPQAYMFIRKQVDRVETITISYRDYAPHGFYIDGVSVDVYFDDVESILNPLYEKNKIKNIYGNTTIQKSLVNVDGVVYSKFSTEIKDDQSFGIVAIEVKKIIEFGAIPFFEEFNSLKKVSDALSSMDEEGISSFLSGIVGIKMPLIKRLVNAADFKKELIGRSEFYKEEVFKYPQYFKDHEKVFNELFANDLQVL